MSKTNTKRPIVIQMWKRKIPRRYLQYRTNVLLRPIDSLVQLYVVPSSVSFVSPRFDPWSDRPELYLGPLGEVVFFPTHLLLRDPLSVRGTPGHVLFFSLLGDRKGVGTVVGRSDSVSRRVYKTPPLKVQVPLEMFGTRVLICS